MTSAFLLRSCAPDESPFKNCSGYGRRELEADTSCFFAASCCLYLLLLSVIIVVIKKGKVYESVMKRLTLWLTAVSFLCQLLLALNLTPLIDYNFFYRNVILCQVYGFVIQYSWSVQLLFMFGVSLLLFSKILEASPWKLAYVSALQERVKGKTFTCHGWECNKEVSFLIAAFVIPFFFGLIPFMTNSYGHFGPFCWIRDIETDCSTHVPGRVQQIILVIVPFGILALLTLGLLVMSLYLLCCAIKNARVQKIKLIQAVGIIDSISFTVSLGFIFVFCVFHIIALSMPRENNKFFLWTIAATLGGYSITVYLLLPIQCAVFSSIARICCKRKRQSRRHHRQQENEAATMHKSELNVMPSHTTWHPPHSSGGDEEHKYFMYEDN